MKQLMTTLLSAMTLASCAGNSYQKHRNAVSEIVPIGSSVYDAQKNLTKAGYEVSAPYDSTKLGKDLWMNVSWGATPGLISTFFYSAGIERGNETPISIIVGSSIDGRVREIK